MTKRHVTEAALSEAAQMVPGVLDAVERGEFEGPRSMVVRLEGAAMPLDEMTGADPA